MTRRPTQSDREQPTELAPARGIADEPRNEPTAEEHEERRREAEAFAEAEAGTGSFPPPPPPPPPDNGNTGDPGSEPRGTAGSPFIVALTRPDDPTPEHYEIALWDLIGATSKAMSFEIYTDFLDGFFRPPASPRDADYQFWEKKRNSAIRRPVSSYGLDAWDLVTCATDIFVKHQAGALSDVAWLVDSQQYATKAHVIPPFPDTGKKVFEDALVKQIGANKNLSSYLELVRKRLPELPTIDTFALSNDKLGVFRDRFESPLLVELIWSYFMEQGMLVQTVNAVLLRFQNASVPELSNPLRMLATDPLRPISNLLWGCLQTQGNRLPIARRVQEYQNAYGFDLIGKAVPQMQVVESRSRFLESFHTLLQSALAFYKEHDDLTVKADGFPLLNVLTEVHTLLAEGANNQFNDLPWTARSEMMAQQWLLARPEFREFLGGRIMVPYPEMWMDRVDTMKSLQSWTDTSITAFYWLATYAEQILLSIRYGNWSMITDGALAAKWAERFRYAVQSYVHYYRQATGVDLSVPVTDARDASRRFRQPSQLIAERAMQQTPGRVAVPAPRAALPSPAGSMVPRRRPMLPSPRTP